MLRAEDRAEVSSPWPAAATVAAPVALAVALFLAAQVRIPLPWTPVPVTLQTLVILVGGAWLGAGRAVAGTILYIAVAAAGLPVLSGFRGGFSAFTGPTGGYVLGWLLAAFLLGRTLGAGTANRRPASVLRVAGLMAAASLIILACGTLHLGLFLGLSLQEALWMGVLPFLPGDALKVAVATAIILRRPRL